MALTISLISNFHSLTGMKQCIHTDFLEKMNMFMIHFDDLITCLQSCCLSTISIFHLRYSWCGDTDISKNDDCQHKGHDKVKNRSRRNDTDPRPDRFFLKRPVIITLAVLALHHTGAAKRQQFNGILCLTFCKSHDGWSQSQRKLIDPDSVGFCQQEMSQFVKQNNRTEQ